jgi:hypothetical protein
MWSVSTQPLERTFKDSLVPRTSELAGSTGYLPLRGVEPAILGLPTPFPTVEIPPAPINGAVERD